MMIERERWFLSIGRDWCRDVPFSIWLFVKRGPTPTEEGARWPSWVNFRISMGWPRFLRRFPCAMGYFREYDSWHWTGRCAEIVDWHWYVSWEIEIKDRGWISRPRWRRLRA